MQRQGGSKMKINKLPFAVIAASALLAAGPALAQKSKDTLRVGLSNL